MKTDMDVRESSFEARIQELIEENERLKKEVESQTRIAARALASYQQRALHMEIIRQQNEDLDQLNSDLEEAKRLVEQRAQEVEQAARLKSEFLANFSHEIRTPLNGIIGYCDLLTREEGGRLTPHGRRDLGTIKSNAKTLLALINDILDVSKIESGHVEVVREVVDLAAICEECSATVRELLKGKDVTVSLDLDERVRRAYVDPLKFKQILLNLLSNAAKFTDIGEIVVNLRAIDATLELCVEDTGIGIPPEQISHIFEKFRQVDGSRTRRRGGTGLGLAIVRELARVLGGSATVDSILGRGSKFTVRLPGALDAVQLQSHLHEVPKQDVASLSSGATVLIIDDDPMVLHLLRGQLEAEDFRVITATDGVEGLRIARSERPSVVVLDIHLPRLDGWSVLSTMKSDPILAAIPVLILSVEEERARGFSLGAIEYLLKPVEPEVLARAVSRAISPEAGEVLVVDDDPSTRQLVMRRLQGEGFTVAEARGGSEALSRLGRSPPAMLVLDLVMPEVDGFEVLRKVREGGRTFPIIVLTGKELSSEEQLLLREGLVRVIQKGGSAITDLVQQAKDIVVRRRSIETLRLPRILYIEDVAQNRDLVRRYLRGSFQLIEAEDGEMGVERAAEEKPDAILMDLSLPRIDGWEATKRIKANPELQKIPIIALTAHASREDMDRAKQAGCSAYLTKPVDCDELLGTLRQQLDRVVQ
jgi:CheY-like chemotaxis protein/signal transduction histidine kinase